MIHSSASRYSHAHRAPKGVGIGQDYYDEQGDAVERDEYYAGVKDVLETGDGSQIYRSLNKLLKSTHRIEGYQKFPFKRAKSEGV